MLGYHSETERGEADCGGGDFISIADPTEK